MSETLQRTVDKKLYKPDPENAPQLKIHIYKEGQTINPRMWKKLVLAGDHLKALRDEHGKMWLALNARAHSDIATGLSEEGISIIDSSDTRFQLHTNEQGQIQNISVPFSLTWDTERCAKKVLQMIPSEYQTKTVTLSGSGVGKEIGSDIITYYDVLGLQIDENDPRVVEVIEPEPGIKYYKVRVTVPEDLRENRQD